MKRIPLLIVATLTMFAAFGCGSQSTTETSGTTDNTQTAPAGDAAGMSPENSQWVSTTKARLDEMNTQMDAWETKVAGMSGNAKDALDKQLDEVDQMREEASRMLADLEGASAEVWAENKAAFDTHMAALETAYERLRTQMS